MAKKAGPESHSLQGAEVIRSYLPTLPETPGVYRMIAHDGAILYVGKAKNLRRRVASYTRTDGLVNRIRRMVSLTRSMEFVTTHTEAEALLLEANLIRTLLPPYNVLVKDDRAFSYIMLGKGHDYPRLLHHRGSRRGEGELFGPYGSPGLVGMTVSVLQRAFQLRTCTDQIFDSRTRPCLQHQIKRCSAPCVGRVTPEEYREQTDEVRAFLKGRSSEVQAAFARRMHEHSERLEYEAAAQWRDRIRALTSLQSRQDINMEGVLDDADVIAVHAEGGTICVQVFFFRGGRNQGTRAFFPSHDAEEDAASVLAAFAGQLYDEAPPPRLVLLSHDLPERELLADALTLRAGHRVEVECPRRGDKHRVVGHALTNAREAHGRRMAERSTQARLLAGVAEAFGLPAAPNRVEVYDNSHIQGAFPVGAMVVAGPEGFQRNAYRRFHLAAGSVDGTTAGSDYDMLREMLMRRFARALKEDPQRTSGSWPDLVLIDGGLGQLNVARDVMTELRITDVPLVAIAKGPDRDAGRERFFMPGREPIQFKPNDPVLYFLQRLRDEAHNTAVESHRARRVKAIRHSRIDEIPGVGPIRKKALLHHFGSSTAVAAAGLRDLENAPGISATVARRVYEHFHGSV
ncbi:excinuclease ABC subunit UvrC [Azospirillum sp. SYSU D00513]|uniref:excinuclease ABC subunit UvrC n=1 Tax=Azospirillum sp. SYSU D00513 TaxID=2812561 RepID=UPI001A95A492|nr:excinuclease ABC subunit UvrC [Azospirillum sp. SYSU D00513]